MKAALPLLRDLIRIPSVNPSGDPGVDNPGEAALALFLKDRLERLGARARLQSVLPGRPNVIGVFRPDGKIHTRILLAPHTDTVSVVGMTVKPFDPVVRNGRVHGRGASDTKGPMAAMLTALARVTRSREWKKSGVEFTFAGLMGEEAGNDGAHAWARVCPKYDLVIVGEPTEMKVVHAHKGALWLKLKTRGRARHASLSTADDNALYHLIPALEYFRDSLPAQLDRMVHPVLGRPSAQITVLKAGTKVNISPEFAEALADIRTVPGMKGKSFTAHLRRELPDPIVLEITGESQPLDTDPGDPRVARLIRLLRGPATAPWFCDAGIFSAAGMPAVAAGPGSIRQAHTADEWISVKALEEGTDQMTRALAAFCSS
ncbi:MAG: M20/M25/M40 family metallo-hydrolase [Candidatus Methylacidiphilales bacterium]|nr:M20/M25/M40 family metallo-hydrolase [Candidatus Methylacidiphilales bacterium]